MKNQQNNKIAAIFENVRHINFFLLIITNFENKSVLVTILAKFRMYFIKKTIVVIEPHNINTFGSHLE